jgi:RNA-binding protein YlmH
MSADTEKEIQQLKKRFAELADKSSRQGIYTFTGFLGLSEQDVFWQSEKNLRYAGYSLYGGMENTDRNVLRFGNPEEFGYEVEFPIKCIYVRPLLPKFADKLSHRDFLGSLMNLGIERSTLGDIKVGENEAYIFCLENVAEYICENLEKIKHTNVKCSITENVGQIFVEKPESMSIQVASIRLDAVISKVYNKSRSECLELFRSGKVFVNGRLCENNSYALKGGEIVNARGYGKFIYNGNAKETRKGKLNVEVQVYR